MAQQQMPKELDAVEAVEAEAAAQGRPAGPAALRITENGKDVGFLLFHDGARWLINE